VGHEETSAVAELWGVASLIYTRLGKYEEADRACLEGIRIAEQTQDPTALAFAYNTLQIAAQNRGNYSTALEYIEKALALYERAENIHGAALASNSMGIAYLKTGRWSTADRHFRQAQSVFSQTGDALHLIFTNNNLGCIARDQGRLEDALGYYGAALKGAEQIGGSPWALGCLHANLGEVRIMQGDAGEGLRHLDLSVELLNRANIREFMPEIYRWVALAALHDANLREAEDKALASLNFARELAMRGEEGCALRVVGQVAHAQGDLARAEGVILESFPILEEVGNKFELARSQLALARVLRDQGRTEEAAKLLENCTQVFEQLDARLELSIIREMQVTV
jgi:tetratricopeptide (TPR) repeat protein